MHAEKHPKLLCLSTDSRLTFILDLKSGENLEYCSATWNMESHFNENGEKKKAGASTWNTVPNIWVRALRHVWVECVQSGCVFFSWVIFSSSRVRRVPIRKRSDRWRRRGRSAKLVFVWLRSCFRLSVFLQMIAYKYIHFYIVFAPDMWHNNRSCFCFHMK